MNAADNLFLPDVQSGADARNLVIQRVGIKSLTYPVNVASACGPQPSVASIDMYVALPADQKGTHMSRFIDVLQSDAEPLSMTSVTGLLARMVERLDAPRGYIEMRLPFFVRKTAPVSGVASLLDYDVWLNGELHDGRYGISIAVAVPVTSLCPCSKEMSAYGAHNQRSKITITVRPKEPVFVAELLRVAEEEASCELYGILKRADEKYVTERAYDNPRFVEDLVRGVAARLAADSRFDSFSVEAENFESIHNHSAYARIAQGF